jgi:DNA-binding LacI/PurR family transcriptional regulator
MAGLVSYGVRVPDEMRIVGIDYVKYSSLLPVPLTTQHQNCADIGAMARITMLQRVEKPYRQRATFCWRPTPSSADRVERIVLRFRNSLS